MSVLTIKQLADRWTDAGGYSGNVVVAVAVALAESGGDSDAHSDTDDWGLWQINGAHASFFGADWDRRLDPAVNARMAYRVSSGGTNWAPWSTAYADIATTGFYVSLAEPEVGSPAYNREAEVRAALASVPAPAPAPAPTPPAPPPPIPQPTGNERFVGAPAVQSGQLNIPNDQLTPGVFNIVRVRYAGIVPAPQPGFWSLWNWNGSSWQQWATGDVIQAGRLVGLLPPGLSLPGGLNARPVLPVVQAAQSQVAGFGRGVEVRPGLFRTIQTEAIPGTEPGVGAGEISAAIPGLPGPPPEPTPQPLDVEGAWANWQDWNNVQIPAHIGLMRRILLDMEGSVA